MGAAADEFIALADRRLGAQRDAVGGVEYENVRSSLLRTRPPETLDIRRSRRTI